MFTWRTLRGNIASCLPSGGVGDIRGHHVLQSGVGWWKEDFGSSYVVSRSGNRRAEPVLADVSIAVDLAKPVGTFEDLPRFAAVGGGNNAVALHYIEYACDAIAKGRIFYGSERRTPWARCRPEAL
jgi:hypothetical protein